MSDASFWLDVAASLQSRAFANLTRGAFLGAHPLVRRMTRKWAEADMAHAMAAVDTAIAEIATSTGDAP